MAINSKQKGNKFERDIANMLSSRFAAYTGKPQSFRRNTDSGSFFGGSNFKRKETHDTDYATYGDLICPRTFLFSVECKNYKDAPILNAILNGQVTQWDTWLKQAKQDAEGCNKDYILIIKYNRTETFCFIDEKFKNHLVNDIKLYYSCSIGVTLSDILKLGDSFFFE